LDANPSRLVWAAQDAENTKKLNAPTNILVKLTRSALIKSAQIENTNDKIEIIFIQ